MNSNFFNNLFSDKKDVLLLPTADFQMGSSTALHPNVQKIKGEWVSLTDLQGWRYINNPHYFLSDRQLRIWKHFNYCLDEAVKKRRGKKLVILLNGDLIDGNHHGTFELVTQNIGEQKDTFIKLFQYMQEKLDYQRGDKTVCIDGTFVHTGDEEESIGAQIGAQQCPSGRYSTGFLTTDINGARIWAYHKGVFAGQGHTRGNACVNKLKTIYYQCLQDGDKIPDLVITAHTHDAYHATWTAPNGQTMHYVILASWQDKTRFVRDNMASNKNKVGLQTITIKANGEIIIDPAMLSESHNGDMLTI